MKKIILSILLVASSNAFAGCDSFINEYGNKAYKCDSLDEYPDYDPSDNGKDDWNKGHQAGADWAEEKGLTDPDECNGYSRSFVDRCRRSLGAD